jgi:Ni,Fe-hydrogenase III small subunit
MSSRNVRSVRTDVNIPGCPPNPHALLHVILVAIGRVSLAPKPSHPAP